MKNYTPTAPLLFPRRSLAHCLAFFLLSLSVENNAFSQGVGINTSTPDPSAALDIQSTNQGLLIPRVSLQNSIDGTTVPAPANGLLVYNTNDQVTGGVGLYQNIGTPASPNWEVVSRFKLPYTRSTNSTSSAFSIGNFNSTSPDNSAMSATSPFGYALITDGKIKISGNGQLPGFGKFLTSDANGNATWQGAVAFRTHSLGLVQNYIVSEKVDHIVTFSNEEYDLQNNFSLSHQSPANTFTAPVKGIYHFEAALSSNNKEFEMTIWSIHENISSKRASNIAIGSNMISTDLELDSGDQVYLGIHQNTEGNILIKSDPERVNFSGRLVIPTL